jgi:hypothetical protein
MGNVGANPIEGEPQSSIGVAMLTALLAPAVVLLICVAAWPWRELPRDTPYMRFIELVALLSSVVAVFAAPIAFTRLLSTPALRTTQNFSFTIIGAVAAVPFLWAYLSVILP